MDKALVPEYMYAKEASEYLLTTERKLSMYRQHGLLKWAKLGRNYIYKREWLDTFMSEWSGYDLSSEEAVRLAINSRKWKEKHGDISKGTR